MTLTRFLQTRAPLLLTLLLLTACGGSNASSTDGGGSQIDAGGIAESCSFENCNGCCDGDVCVAVVDDNNCGEAGSACETCTGEDACVAGSCVANNDCSDCSGCCFEGEVCLEGNTLSACGSSGDACVACPQGQGCNSDGECVATACDASNCAGCCTANGECLTDSLQTTNACGDDGAACQVCDSEAVSCTLGTCILDQPCLDFCDEGCCNAQGQCIVFDDQDPDTCGAAETCSACTGDLSCIDGSCTADPVWTVIVNSALISPTNADGEDWDQTLFSNPLPDPYITGALANDVLLDWATATIDNTLTPNWDEEESSYLQSDLLAEGLILNVRDSDGLGVFETIGACFVDITLDDLLAGTLTKASCEGASDIVLDFVQQ